MNPNGYTVVETNFYGTGRQLNGPYFSDPIRNPTGGTPYHRTISASAHISANTGIGGGGGSVNYTVTAQAMPVPKPSS